MLGWLNDCIEKFVIERFGVDAWHQVKQLAGCKVEDGGFVKLERYADQTTTDLVMAASQVSGLLFDEVLEALGTFWSPYIVDTGYGNLLECQGNTLKNWMANINAIHQHLQTTFPNKMTMPQFWVETHCSGDGSLVLYHHSMRGSFLSPIAQGLVKEVAQTKFELDIKMDRLATQDLDGAKFTR